MGDPNAVSAALERAEQSFVAVRPSHTHEDGIEPGDWETQLTKGCRLRESVATLRKQDGYHTAVVELCFGVIERSIEAYAVAMAGDDPERFHDHEACYDRAAEVGLFERTTATRVRDLYADNRTESYYGGTQPTDEQAAAMADLAGAVHEYVVSQIRTGGVCQCR